MRFKNTSESETHITSGNSEVCKRGADYVRYDLEEQDLMLTWHKAHICIFDYHFFRIRAAYTCTATNLKQFKRQYMDNSTPTKNEKNKYIKAEDSLNNVKT